MHVICHPIAPMPPAFKFSVVPCTRHSSLVPFVPSSHCHALSNVQDTVRRKHGSRSAAALHSAAPLERPKHADSQGYNVAFVDASEDASIGSKVAHGCTPNCKAVTVSINGKLSLGIFTTHHIPEGQELSRDHAFVTELEQEFRSSTCLCSSSCCRGFSLFYVNSKSFHEILSKHHTFLDRTAMILAACTDELTPADELRLSRHGVSSLRYALFTHLIEVAKLLPSAC